MNNRKIRELYDSLCIEQDEQSPHSYRLPHNSCAKSDIAADIGAAEGIWGLSVIDEVRELYLFECEEEWIQALNATFSPWKEKVHIVNKFVADITDNEHTTLDNYFLSEKIYPTCIKADIEGDEPALVRGAEQLLSGGYIRDLLLCTYHNEGDLELLSTMLQKHGFKIETTKGYIAPIYSLDNYNCADVSTLFRKGLIHAHRSYPS
jgi:hypothetical protein